MNPGRLKFALLILVILTISLALSAQQEFKRNNLFDSGWKFHRGGAQGAESPSFDDSEWRLLDLPHDWSIEDLPGTNSPFSADAISQVNGGFTTGGTGWYRKTFTIPEKLNGRQYILMFEGVYMNADVWLNGELIGNHPYGYTSFWFDLTKNIKPGSKNLLAVKVKNEGENSRWYSGSGIYRHVWLSVISPVHLKTWGTFITTPAVNEKEATIHIKSTIVNGMTEASKISVITKILQFRRKDAD